MSRRWLRNARYHADTALFLLPWLVGFGIFSIYPIFYSLFLSFTEFTASGNLAPRWIGIENYANLLHDERFGNSVINSFYFTLGSVPITIFMAIPVGIFLDQKIRMRTLYRVSLFMPVVASMFVIATLFTELYANDGIINDIMNLLGFKTVNWLKDPDWAMPSIIVMNIWASFGFYSLVILAALQSIPREYYEISKLEGASTFQCFFKLTLPLIKPTVIFCFILNSILAFQAFGEIYIMTKGGPLGSTETSVFYIYDMAFDKRKLGLASAASYVIFVILALLSIIQAYSSKSKKRG